jgi:hypothetical protein
VAAAIVLKSGLITPRIFRLIRRELESALFYDHGINGQTGAPVALKCFYRHSSCQQQCFRITVAVIKNISIIGGLSQLTRLGLRIFNVVFTGSLVFTNVYAAPHLLCQSLLLLSNLSAVQPLPTSCIGRFCSWPFATHVTNINCKANKRIRATNINAM